MLKGILIINYYLLVVPIHMKYIKLRCHQRLQQVLHP